MSATQFPCAQCGAKMAFDPSARSVKCAHCGHESPVPRSETDIQELDFHAWAAQAGGDAASVDTLTVRCSGCGAETTLPENITADVCPFCSAAVVAQEQSRRLIKPRSLLPFSVTKEQALQAFGAWVRRLWFAPGKLRECAQPSRSRLAGVYLPHWTYDADTVSWYTGERGDDYYVTETYHVTVNGKSQIRTRQVKRTRWTSVSGMVAARFDDVLVPASKSLPRDMAERLEPWDLEQLVAYDAAYLAGFRTESYQVGLEDGFARAREVMDGRIAALVRSDIGGDHQRIHSVRTQHNRLTFKHLLLPVWISAYRFSEKTYRFVVNARTGEVIGERPWSWVKIAGAVLAVFALAGLALLAMGFGR